MNGIQLTLQRLRIMDEQVSGKAREYLQLLNTKVPNLKKAEIARSAIAVEFALKFFHYSYDERGIIESSMVQVKDYREAYIKCKNILQIQFIHGNVLDILTVQSGQPSLKSIASRILRIYQEQITANLSEFQRKQAHDLSAPVYEAAAFKIACKINNVSLDRKQVLALCEIDGSYFDNIVEKLAVSYTFQ